MPCKSCGGAAFADLGRCGRCMLAAVASSGLFWSLYYACRARWHLDALAYGALLFAILTSLLLVAHLLAFGRYRLGR